MSAPVPVAPAPPGVTPDFESSHVWLRITNLVMVIVELTISTGFLLMRIYTKAHIMKKFWWDDGCIIFAWVLSVITQTLILYGFYHGGIGVHIWNITISTFDVFQKVVIPAQSVPAPSSLNSFVPQVVLAAAIIYIPALAFAKLAILMLYYRLLRCTKTCRYVLYSIAAVIVSYSIALMLALIFACHPIERAWNVLITTGSCIDRPAVYLTTAITNTISDVVLILTPIPIVIRLQLPGIQKLGVLCIFGVGCLTIVTSIVRLATLWPLVTSLDPTYKLALASIFINIEANFIIICGCIPYFRQFLRHHTPTLIANAGRRLSEHSSEASESKGRRKPGLTQLQDDIEIAVHGVHEISDSCGGREVYRGNVLTGGQGRRSIL